MEIVHIREKDSKDLIYKSNNLINSKYNITLIQARYLGFVSSLINAYDDDFFTYSIRVQTILKFLDIDRKNLNWLSESLKQLLTTMICLQNREKVEEYTTFLSHFKLDKANDILEFSFHSSLKPHFLKLKNNFTKLKLEQYNKFESVYTLRFYEWLEYNFSLYDTYKNSKFKTIEITLDELLVKFTSSYNYKKKKFEIISSYNHYKNFKRKVLEVAKNELSTKSDIYFEYQEIKVNRAVESLVITIIKNEERSLKEFKEKKKKNLQSSTRHKQIAQEQIKRILARAKEIKDPLKYEQKLYQKFLKGTLKFDKDLQEINERLDKEIFDSI
ncbi:MULTISPECIES: replication initiation protein [Aliarcobacter]|uniref:Replication initiation protein n=1 Tax=Aliarcobacter skirrowii CCUG 10374 TaxID=1032239 RepID=A0AAD0SQP1_9BACT|nr:MULTISPECIES: replication initiation protein [Aliarcobacter]AXX84660.1 replication initiation protein [Aliarcobacter skirrowii CCUG 10374]KAB0620205.1 replication initiation protein [Aliarcobacter skirrowii CCUG 10374]OCL85516.1 Initiator Replication protein [Aliarcobacter thereius]RXI25388.1 replication initiation protein [Aliarcobacter skirrowii CCUG 10374]SUV14831.1 replication protein [Aliarcobacter skirrowii]